MYNVTSNHLKNLFYPFDIDGPLSKESLYNLSNNAKLIVNMKKWNNQVTSSLGLVWDCYA